MKQFTVRADRNTGEWLTEPEYVTDVELNEWMKNRDTDAVHYDHYQADLSDEEGRSYTEERAIAVVWEN